MSGIEVVGLVLDAIPIAVWALERSKTVGLWRRFELTYARLSNRFKVGRVLFRQHLVRLLRPLFRQDTDDLESLLEEASSGDWSRWLPQVNENDDVASRLEQRLGGAYETYMSVLRELMKEMVHMWMCLQGDDLGFQQYVVDRLRNLPAFSTRLACSAIKHQRHRASLSLRHASVDEHPQRIEHHNTKLRRLLSGAEKAVETNFEDDQPDAKPDWQGLLTFWEPNRVAPTDQASRRRSDAGMRVAFVEGERSLCAVALRAGQGITRQLNRPVSHCKLLRRSRADGSYGNLYWVLDRYPYTVLTQEPTPSLSSKHLALSKVLELKEEARPSRVERLRLALAITTSYLRLYSAAWIAPYLLDNCVQVAFENAAVDHKLMPFVEAPFNVDGEHSRPSGEACQDLAILFIQLCFGRRIQHTQHWKEVVRYESKEQRRLAISQAIHDWALSVSAEAGPLYQQAVDWCLERPSGIKGGQAWRHSFAQTVVLPLQKCCRSLEGQ
ncbi:hypothetical protein EJ03DRAFT_35715 [Teratosphaeria nubilosa]|uniref:Uncharacterized protein n=1 Tax=Teratosphaeria nubilosa TaxID=161662 RepID=A0A6G1KU14_9PEZI|nr:hypothetical protein EJ03DRAFT_35715 [Teratosphaeria nubilosa]